MNSQSVFVKLLLVTAGAVLIMPIYIFTYLSPAFTSILTQKTEDHTVQFADYFANMLYDEGFDFQAESIPDNFSDKIAYLQKSFNFYKAKVFSADGTIIFSTDPAEIGEKNTRDYFWDIVVKGSPYSKIVSEDSLSMEGETVQRDVVETYAPVVRNDVFLGAFEFYFDITDHTQEYNRLLFYTNLTTIFMTFGLLIIILFGYNLVRKSQASKRIAEETADRMRHRHDLILNAAGEGIFSVDQHGSITFINSAAANILGYSIEEMLGKKAHQLLHHSRPDGIPYPAEECPFYGSYKGGLVSKNNNETFWKKDGTSFPVDYISTPIHENHQVVGAVIMFQNIKERILSEKERDELQKQVFRVQRMESVGRLAGGVAHDFNNLLTGIIGYAGLCEEQVDPDSTLAADLKEVATLAGQASNLTRQLLAFSRQQMLEQEIVNLNTLVTGIVKMLRRLIGENVELVFNQADEPCIVKADAGQIEQVLVNLAINARDAMPNGGVLTISTFRVNIPQDELPQADKSMPPAVYAKMTVKDTGTGIDKETISQIFDPFFTTKELGMGSGMGLSTVYGIIEQHRGTIQVESEPGKGTCFTIYLPCVDPEEEVRKTSGDEDSKIKQTRTVLLVEDEDAVRIVTQRFLEKEGYRVFAANDAEEAEKLFNKEFQSIDILLTDIVMPKKDGRELYNILVMKKPGLKVLFMSGYSDEILTVRNILDTGIPFIHKPFSKEKLSQKLEKLFKESNN
jgi:PAS domain S-box-containing protein